MAKKKAPDSSPGPEAYRSLLPPLDYERLLEALAEPLPAGLRANPLKINIPEAERNWSSWYGWDMRPVPFCPTGWTLVSADARPSQTPEFKLGFFYLQDAASMLPAELFSFEELDAPLVLDMAAAPGGKSTHLASRSGDRGLLVANDSSFGRIPVLHTTLLDWGAMNSVITNQPGEKFGRWFPDTFDRVLLDAPCSMDNLRPASRHTKRSISIREHLSLASRQVGLLISALEAVKPGGEVVYSTCTLAPEEDEGVVDTILKHFSGLVRLDDIHTENHVDAPGLTRVGDTSYSAELVKSVRMWPHLFGTSGFFAARMTKLSPSGTQPEPSPQHTFSRLGFEALSKAAMHEALDHLQQTYGFDFQQALAEKHLTLWKHKNGVIALPEKYLQIFSGFPVHLPGFPLYEQTRDGMILSHEAASRFGSRFERGKLVMEPGDINAWLRGSDLMQDDLDQHLNSIVIIVDEKNRLLGRGKVLRDRIKNMLPRRLALN